METLHYPKLAQPPVARLKTSPPPRPQAAPADGAFTFGKRFFRPDQSGLAVVESWFWRVRAVMNNPDHDTLVRAIDDLGGEYLEP